VIGGMTGYIALTRRAEHWQAVFSFPILSVMLIVFIVSVFVFFVAPASAEIYKYVKKDGSVGYSDSIQAVPEEYRKKATVVKGLRENEGSSADKTKTKPAVEAPRNETTAEVPRKIEQPLMMQVKKASDSFMEKGYWKHVVVICVFILVYFLLGKASRAIGHKEVWTLLRILVVLGIMSYFFYVYTKEISEIYSSMVDSVKGASTRIDKRRSEEKKID